MHKHVFDPSILICSCGRTVEEEYNGDLTQNFSKYHNEVIWPLVFRLHKTLQKKGGDNSYLQ